MHYQCKKCLYIEEVSKDKKKRVCTKCGNNTKNQWVEYPVPAASGFLTQAGANIHSSDEFSLYYFHELQTACLFLCALYEILLEGLISDLNTLNRIINNG